MAGAFSGDFTTNLAPQCRAFSRALKIEKLKAPLFRGPEGAGATNDWCITSLKYTVIMPWIGQNQRNKAFGMLVAGTGVNSLQVCFVALVLLFITS